MEGCAANGANLYPGHRGFAAQLVHHMHNHLPGHGVPWCLAHPRDTHHSAAQGSTSPEPRSPNHMAGANPSCSPSAVAEHGLLHPMHLCLWVMGVARAR